MSTSRNFADVLHRARPEGAWSSGRTSLLVLAFVVPVVFNPRLADVFNLTKATLAWLAILAAAVSLAVAVRRREGPWPKLRVLAPIGAFLAVGLVASLASDSRLVSFIGLYTRYGGFLSQVLYAAAAVLTAVLLRDPQGRALRRLAVAFVAAAAVAAGYAVLQKAGIDAFEFREASGAPAKYPGSTLGNSAFAGAFIGMTLPLLFLLWREAASVGWRVAFGVLALLDVAAVWVTQSRSGMLAVGAGAAVLLWLEPGRRAWLRRAGVVFAASLVAAVAVLVLWHPGRDAPPAALARLEVLRTESLEIRGEEWATAVRIWKDQPVLGSGPDTYYVHYPRYRSAADAREFGLLVTDKPHNLFLEYLQAEGVLGLLAFLAVIGATVVFALRRLRALPPPDDGGVGSERLLLMCWLATLAAYFAQASFSFDVPPIGLAGWMAIGALAALADPGSLDAPPAPPVADGDGGGGGRAVAAPSPGTSGPWRRTRRRSASTPPWLVPAAGALAAFTVTWIASRPVRADAAAARAARLDAAAARPDDIDAAAAEAARLNPLEGVYRQQAGRLAEQRAGSTEDPSAQKLHLAEALEHHEAALSLQPKNLVFVVDLARARTLWAQAVDPEGFDAAESTWQQAIELDPNDWQVHNQHALMLNSWANARQGDTTIRARALDAFRHTTGLKPDHAPAWLNLAKMALALGQRELAEAALTQTLELEPANEEASALLERGLLQERAAP